MKETIPNSFLKQSKRLLLAFTLTIFFSAAMIAQVMVSGTVVDETGASIPGVNVLEVGTTNGTITDIDGSYSLKVASNATIQISFTGYTTKEFSAGNGGQFNISLEPDNKVLEEVVVTGYQVQRKRDISGAVSVINTKDLKGIQASSFTQTLAGRAPGVTISSSGSPGDATNVRVRGISSFSNNDPLIIIDGVPTVDKFNTSINPNDIESMQVLKDASTASIYGSRASNGVIVITTKKGKSGKVKMSYDGSYGIANPVKGFDDVLNTDSKTFVEAIKLKFASDPANAPAYTQGNLPKYIVPTSNTVDEATYDVLTNPITLTNQTGTNWWKEMTRPAGIQNHNITVSGGSDKSTFMVSAGYLSQEGVLNYTDFNRGSLRANTTFNVSKKFRIGENLVVTRSGGVGVGSTGGQNNEQGVLGSLLKANPLISVRDIKGNPGSNLAIGLSNNNNPVAQLEQNKDNKRNDTRLLGNIFAELDLADGLSVKTNFGSDIYSGFGKRFTYPNPYRNEGDKTANSFSENWANGLNWNWTNTITYRKTFADKHNVSLLAGQEAISNSNRFINASLANYFTTDVNSWYVIPAFGANATRNVGSGGGENKLASLFGKVDYSFDDKYFVSATIRRDGSSNFLSDKRYGIFPAASVAWRVSKESFLSDVSWLSDLKLRASYGSLGNQQVARYSFTDIFGGDVGSTGYDIGGTNTSTATGFGLTNRGNPSTVWESAKTQNFGLDLGLLDNALTVVLDIYKRNTDNLLFNPQLPGTAGAASAPFVNVGSMVNTGFDLGINYNKNISKDLGMTIGLNLAHYKNEIVAIDDAGTKEFYPNDNLTERLPQSASAFVNKLGYPISSFRGYEVEGIITTEAEVERQKGTGAPAIGGLKFKDQNNDGVIDDKDNTIIGSPHPDLVAGLNIGFDYKNFDVNAFIFGSYGNEIFNATKIQTYFMNFNSNVGKDVVAVQGTGLNPKINGLDASSRSSSSFYVEDGSYTRLSNFSLGYKITGDKFGTLGVESVRVYIQGQNLFTITNYSGVDPAVSNANIGNAGNVNDLRTGYDNGNYPSNKIISFGLNVGF